MPKKQRRDDDDWSDAGFDRAFAQADRIIATTAQKIAAAIEAMNGRLPPQMARDTALYRLVRELAALNPKAMQLILEDSRMREAFETGAAEAPATPGDTTY